MLVLILYKPTQIPTCTPKKRKEKKRKEKKNKIEGKKKRRKPFQSLTNNNLILSDPQNPFKYKTKPTTFFYSKHNYNAK